MKVILWTAWYTCFPSVWPLSWLVRGSLFFLLFIIGLYNLPQGGGKDAVKVITLAVALMCLAGTVFADYYPIPFIIKLSLWRSTVVFLFVALPCIACLLSAVWNHTAGRRFLVIATIALLTGYLKSFTLPYAGLLIALLLYALGEEAVVRRFPFMRGRFGMLTGACLAALFAMLSYTRWFSRNPLYLLVFFLFTAGYLQAIKMLAAFPRAARRLQQPWAAALVFIVVFDAAVLYHKGGPEIYYHGRVQGKADPWADIQRVAQRVSDRDDLFIVPPFRNDFGIYSLRASLGDWAEGSHALYLDAAFTNAWLERMNDIGWRELHGSYGYNTLSTEQALKAAKKYRAKFIVTEKQHSLNLKKMYENDSFILYQAR
jgi:hypothetical protein